MKQTRINRRQFFKLSAFGAGTVAVSSLVSVVGSPPRHVVAEVEQPHKLAIPQPTFNPIASTTAFGSPTDLSSGWDGTLWAIDASGAPHLYDPTSDAWLPFGDGIDACAVSGNTLYVFRRGQYVESTQQVSNSQYITVDLTTDTVISGPTDVAATWPNLPDSFKLRLTGAAGLGTTLVMVNGGWYVPADGSAPRAKLTDLANWPTTANWADGIVDFMVDTGLGVLGKANLFRNGEFINVDFSKKEVTGGPFPANSELPPSLAATGADAGALGDLGATIFYFQGTSVVSVPSGGGAAQTAYLPAVFKQWPATWHPVLNHAPSGRMGNLWCATRALGIVQHDGEAWNAMPGGGVSAAVGQDGIVMVGSVSGLYRWNGTNYDALGGSNLVQACVGDGGHVWVLNNTNDVYRYDATNGFQQVTLGAGVPAPTHMAANADGTLWHVTSGNPNAFRLISESSNPSAQIQLKGAGIVTSVNKVASTGFGAAHCLATHNDGSTNVYRYDSPYVFKTSQEYSSYQYRFEQGLGNLYFLVQVAGFVSPEPLQVCVVALDAHTGREVSRSVPNQPNEAPYSAIVFDPIHELVYATIASGAYTDQARPGQVLALDARDLTQVKWRYSTPTGIDAVPVLNGTRLCFGDRENIIYMFDTDDALQNAAAPQPKWTWQVPTQGIGTKSSTHRVATPVLTNGNVVAAVWDVGTQAPGGNELGSALYFAKCNAADGSSGIAWNIGFVGSNVDYLPNPSQPALGRMPLGDGSTPQALYINGNIAVYGVNIETAGPPDTISFKLPDGTSTISTGIVYDDGSRVGAGGGAPDMKKARVWFGDGDGNLWSLLPLLLVLTPVDSTPFQAKKATIFTTPVIYKDQQGGVTVLFGMNNVAQEPPTLYGYDPDNGNSASVGTGVTLPITLSNAVTNGVIYVGGSQEDIATGSVPQVFGIRVDALPQALRDFVIESQMMQDPDQNASGGDPSNNVPPSVARYQTHLTVVDDGKAPQVHEPVKIWCDTPNTVITVDGTKFTIGPDDASYAAVKTGTDGSLVITMDATDYFAPTLRAWAGFMDPYERIVVNADTEFHQRVMTAHANANDDDPDKVNLQTATNYNGQSLFTDDEKNQNPSAPSNVANSIQTADKGLGISNGSGSSKALYRKLMRAMGVKHKNQRISVRWIDFGSPPSREGVGVGETPDKYMAYADLPGATHFPTNIPVTRLAPIVGAVGLSFSRPNGDVTKAPVFTAMSHADARAAIDALQGEPWKPTDPQGGPARAAPFRTFNIWQDFWNWLKGLFDKIAQVFLSIAEDIMAGIQYILNGIAKVFKAIIKVLEDVFPFLGSFFKLLDKLIDDVVEAVSVLLHFGEIIKTHNFIRDQVNSLLSQAEAAIANNVKPAVDNFFNTAEQEVKAAFDKLIAKIEPNKQGNNLKGAGSTAHTAFSAGPGVYGAGSGTSHAVQCTYGLQKLKSNADSGSESGTGFGINSAGDDAIVNLWTTFTNQISSNPTLKAALDGLGSGVGNLFQSNSASDFFKNLLVTLLELLETLIEGMLVVTNAFLDLILNAIADIISTIQTFLNTPIDIPFISWLYQTVFGEPLTFLNVLCLVAAIPVTILYRVIEGRYPSQDFPSATSSVGIASHRDLRRATVNPLVTKILGAFSGILAFTLGIVNGLNDALGEESNAFLSKLSAVLGVAATAISIPLASSDSPSINDWISWGAEWCASALGIFGAIEWTDALAELWNYFSPGLTTAMGLFEIIFFAVAFISDAQFDPNSDLSFAANVLSGLTYVINPVKLLTEIGALVVAGVDAIAGIAVCVIDFIVAFANLGERAPRRLHLPWIAYSPQPDPAHPLKLSIAAP